MNTPRFTDTTLRDGSHAMGHQFTLEHVRGIAKALDDGGVDLIEVTHGDGLSGSSIQYGASLTDELELITAAREVVTRAKIAVLLLPGIGTRQDLRVAVERGAQVVRIATQCSEADVAEQHFSIAKELGLETVGFLMMSHMLEPEALLEQAKKLESYGADTIYSVDSAGAMLPHDVTARIDLFKRELTTRVGYHAHNNLGLAVGNSLAALEAGADAIDGTLRGLGAGAGNLATELWAMVQDKLGLTSSLNAFALSDAAEFLVKPIMKFQPMPDRDSSTVGYAGVYSTFLLHARRIGQELGVDPRAILVELGRRRAVAGQEDWILDVALEIKRDSANQAGVVA
jgi:4-hydroxy 2-oxovalerate aldolase